MSAIPLPRKYPIEYPTSDGNPMAETEVHLRLTMYLIQALDEHFSAAPDVYVVGDMLFYYEEGRPQSVVAPDVFVVQGIPKKIRQNYLLWEEGKVPSLVIEVTSRTTRVKDLTSKKNLYERLGVTEYLLFDPLGDYLDPRLRGFRLTRGKYQSMAPSLDGSLVSRTTGVLFRPEGDFLRLTDAASGQPLLSHQEWRERAKQAEEHARQAQERAQQAEDRATSAEARAQALAEELQRLRQGLEP